MCICTYAFIYACRYERVCEGARVHFLENFTFRLYTFKRCDSENILDQ